MNRLFTPWHTASSPILPKVVGIGDNRGELVATVYPLRGSHPAQNFTASLIASAPEMYSILKNLRSRHLKLLPDGIRLLENRDAEKLAQLLLALEAEEELIPEDWRTHDPASPTR